MPSLSNENRDKAIAAYRDGLLAGTWTPDDSRRMLSLSPDPEALMAGIREANRDPTVAEALQEMMRRHGMADTPVRVAPKAAAIAGAAVRSRRGG